MLVGVRLKGTLVGLRSDVDSDVETERRQDETRYRAGRNGQRRLSFRELFR